MIKTLAKCMGKYKKESIITPIFTAVEVFLEILIPFITASIIDKGIQAGETYRTKCVDRNRLSP